MVSVILMVLLISCGCISAPNNSPEGNITQTTGTIPVSVLPTTLLPVTTVQSTPTVDTEPVLTDEIIKKHFLNIAFGRDSNYIQKSYTDSGDRISFYLSGKFDEKDEEFIRNFTRDYNRITTTTTFSDEVLKSRQRAYPGEIDLVFFPADSLKSMEESGIRHKDINTKTGDILFYIPRSGDTIYINTDLSGDERKHAITRALLYNLGFPGQTYDYPGSIFYANSYENTVLSPIDIAAVNTMYDGRIYPGMSFDEVKRVLLFT